MRACAIRAGFGANIHLVTEREAAVTYALDAMDPGTLTKGDTFVLVDGGAGTGDLISYTIEDLEGGVKVREAAAGSSALCGSSFLNHICRDLLVDRFADDDDWETDILDEAMQRFELWTKRTFTGEDGMFVLPVSSLGVKPALGVKRRGKLPLSLKEMKKIFEPVITVMTTLVQNQINATATKVKAILLVGGFGQNAYLKRTVQEVVGPSIQVLQPAEGDVAVVKGALIRGLALTSPLLTRVTVSSRVSRKSYGTRAGVEFDEAVYNEDDK
jgi:molecular chaperone DnaK (HSP70)